MANLSLLSGALARLESAVLAGDLPGQVRGVSLALDAVRPLVEELITRGPDRPRSVSHMGGECFRQTDALLDMVPPAPAEALARGPAWDGVLLRIFLEWLRSLLKM